MTTPTPEQRKQGIAALFDRASETYDSVGVDFFTVFGRRLVALAEVAPGEGVLDVGCGRGAVTFAAASAAGPEGSVVAIDLAPGMVERTAAAARDLPHVEVRIGDAEAPDVEGPFDVVLSSLVIFFLSDPVAAIGAYRALLRDGGRLGLTTFPEQPETAWTAMSTAMERFLPPQAANPRPGTGPLSSPEALAETLRGNGFGDVRTVTEGFDTRFRDRDHWWSWAWSHGQRFVLERVPADELDDVKAELYGLLDPVVQPDGSLTLTQYVTYTVATAG